jgi:hypothetical protein
MDDVTSPRYQQDMLFNVPPSLRHVDGVTPTWLRGPWVYACHMFQKTGDPFWKIGTTEASVFVRARQIACVPVAWWPGTEQDERRWHREWKKKRLSPAGEFFRHGYALDAWVRRQILEMPETLRGRQLDVYDQIMRRFLMDRYRREDGAA